MPSLIRLLRAEDHPDEVALRYAVAVFRRRRVYQRRLETWLEEQRRLRGVYTSPDPARAPVQEGRPADPTPAAALWTPRWPEDYPPDLRRVKRRLDALDAALAELSPDTRAMLTLFVDHGKDIAELARRFGITAAAVYARFKVAERVFRRLGRRLTV